MIARQHGRQRGFSLHLWSLHLWQVLLATLPLLLLSPDSALAQTGNLLSVEITGDGMGRVTSDDGNIDCPGDCSQSYFAGELINLTAQADPGSVFDGWQGCEGGVSGNTCQRLMTSPDNVTAVFSSVTPPGGTLSVSVSGDGQVTSSDQGINCPGDCSETYEDAASVTLTAVPGSGQAFDGWQGGGCSGTGVCNVTMTGDRNVTALFSSDDNTNTLNVTRGGTGSGQVSSDIGAISCPGTCSDDYASDAVVTLTADPAAGSTFTGWQGGGCSGTGSCVVPMTMDRNVLATFDSDGGPGPGEPVTVSVALAGSGSGSVSSNDQAINCTPTCSASYPADSGATLTLSAQPAPGSSFVEWQGACTGSGPCVVTLGGNRSVTAVFQDGSVPPPVVLSVSTGGSGSGRVRSDDQAINCPGTCSQSYAPDTSVTLTASPAQGSVFAGWQGGSCSGTGPCSLTLAASTSVSALFQLDGDDDKDLVPNPIDQCPNTPPGETVDEVGCSVTQPPGDDDQDGVPNTIDQCPDTPPGAQVDEVGCALDGPQGPQQPEDDDGDGVPNTIDQCPNTPPGATVNEVGCSPGEPPDDDDDDNVPNTVDKCANTPPGAAVDSDGCSVDQSDDDGDGVVNSVDACADTPAYVAAVDSDGCPAIIDFGNQLGNLAGLSGNERLLGTRLDEICPMLIKLSDLDDLTEGQEDLREACTRLKNPDTTESQAARALREISLTELASLQTYAIDIATAQNRHIGNRMHRRRQGQGGGVSTAGLNLRVDDQVIPGHLLQSAVDEMLGMGAGEDSFVDFGRLGLFIQGDIHMGERDETELESGFDFDAWSLSLGGDYRFSDRLWAGAAVSFGSAEVDYDLDGGNTDIDNWTLAVYSGWSITENLYLDGMISYGQSDISTNRNVSYVDAGGSFDSRHEGDTDGDQIFVGLNAGYVLNRGSWRFGPVASLAYLDGDIDGFTETSRGEASQAWNYAVDDQDFKSLRISVGAQADYILNTSFGVIIPGIRVAFVSEQEDGEEEVSMRLVNNPFLESELVSDQIVVTTDKKDSSYLDSSFNLSGQFIMGFSGYFSYQFYSSFDDYSRDSFTIGLRWDKPF